MTRCKCNRWELLKFFPESIASGIDPECRAHVRAMPLQTDVYTRIYNLARGKRTDAAIRVDDSYDDLEVEKEVIADPVPEEELLTDY